MILTGTQLKTVHEALLSCFTSQSDLARCVRFCLDKPLDVITTAKNLSNLTFELLEWAENNNQVENLIQGAYEENPANTDVQNLLVLYPKWVDEWEKQNNQPKARRVSQPDSESESESEHESSSTTETEYISLTLNRDIDAYDQYEQQSLLRAIRQLLQVTDEVRLINVEAGSVIVTIELPRDKTTQLLSAVANNQFVEFDVVDAQRIADLTQSPSRLRYAEQVRREGALMSLPAADSGVHTEARKKRTNQEWIDALQNHSGERVQQDAFEELGNYLYVVANNYLIQISSRIPRLQEAEKQEISSLAEDFTHDVIVKLVRDDYAILRQYSGGGKFTVWVAQILINRISAELRRARWSQNVHHDLSELDNYKTLAIDLQQLVSIELLNDALDQLQERYRIVLVRCIIEGQPTNQVAKELGISPSAIYLLIHRAKQQISKIFSTEGAELPEYLSS